MAPPAPLRSRRPARPPSTTRPHAQALATTHAPPPLDPEPDPDPDETNPSTLQALHVQCRSFRILLRVHSHSSASPLIWTGDMSSSGFFTPNSHLAGISPQAYSSVFTPFSLSVYEPPPSFSRGRINPAFFSPHAPLPLSLSMTTLIPGPYLRHTMIDHILQKRKQTCLPIQATVEEIKDGVFEDEKTPWISTSSEAFWCIWEIEKALFARLGRRGGNDASGCHQASTGAST